MINAGDRCLLTWFSGEQEQVVVILRYVSGLLLVGPLKRCGKVNWKKTLVCSESDLTPLS